MREMARILKCTQEHLDGGEVTMAELLNVTQYSKLENALITLSLDENSGQQKHGLLLSIGNNLKLMSFEIARYAFIPLIIYLFILLIYSFIIISILFTC